MENPPLTHFERIKSVTDFAIKNNLPPVKVLNLYNEVNDILYRNIGENSVYNPDIENVTFNAIERYFSRLN
jgi:hypothetical protein